MREEYWYDDAILLFSDWSITNLNNHVDCQATSKAQYVPGQDHHIKMCVHIIGAICKDHVNGLSNIHTPCREAQQEGTIQTVTISEKERLTSEFIFSERSTICGSLFQAKIHPTYTLTYMYVRGHLSARQR